MADAGAGPTDQKTAAAVEWAAMVDAHHAQTARLREAPRQPDAWTRRAGEFRPHRRADEKDPAIDAILEHVRPEDTVLDVGAGGGRLAIPIAQRCREVVAVEPSEAMRAQLESQAAGLGVSNITTVASGWEEAVVEPVDIVMCSHVLYAVREPELWVRKMCASARHRVFVLLYHRPVPPNMHQLWEPVHGEKRLQVPALAHFEALLTEMGIQYEKTMLPERPDRGYADFDAALQRAARHLYLVPGSEKHGRLEQALRQSLVEAVGGLQLRWASPMLPGLITWATTR